MIFNEAVTSFGDVWLRPTLKRETLQPWIPLLLIGCCPFRCKKVWKVYFCANTREPLHLGTRSWKPRFLFQSYHKPELVTFFKIFKATSKCAFAFYVLLCSFILWAFSALSAHFYERSWCCIDHKHNSFLLGHIFSFWRVQILIVQLSCVPHWTFPSLNTVHIRAAFC